MCSYFYSLVKARKCLNRRKKNSLEEECNMPQHKRIQDVIPGWNSMLSVLDRLVKQKAGSNIDCHLNIILMDHFCKQAGLQ